DAHVSGRGGIGSRVDRHVLGQEGPVRDRSRAEHEEDPIAVDHGRAVLHAAHPTGERFDVRDVGGDVEVEAAGALAPERCSSDGETHAPESASQVGVRAAHQAPPAPTTAGYGEVRALTEALAAPLSPEDQTVQSIPDVSPTKWHRAHTTWFFETFVLQPYAPRYRVFDESYGYLFNSYYEAVGPRHTRTERGLLSRPGAAEIGRYRAHVDEAMAGFLDGDLAPSVRDLVELGLHHEQQHQELLLMDIQHVLSVNPTRPAYEHVDPGVR